jgi:hypothetical protein
MPSTSCDNLQGRCVPARDTAQFPIQTGLGVNYYSGRSHHPRERISGKCPAPFQAQGATGRHHQGNKEAQLLHEARREAPGQRSAFAEATAQEAAARSGLTSLSPRLGAALPRIRPPRQRRLGFCCSFVPAGPRDPFRFPTRQVSPMFPGPGCKVRPSPCPFRV